MIRRHHISTAVGLLLCAAPALSMGGCAQSRRQGPTGFEFNARAPQRAAEHNSYLAPTGLDYDLVTPSGIHVKTNGQYKNGAARKAAAAAIDRYWRDVRECVMRVIPPGDTTIAHKMLPEFPQHLSIEIADNWRIVQGPVTHRRQQAFPSERNLGALVTASREEEALYVRVVPELNGLARQMAGEVNLWFAGNTNLLPGDLSNVCADLPCHRFDYDNSPSQAWDDCS